MKETRWQRVEREQSERRRRDGMAADIRWSHWTGRRPLVSLVVFLVLSLVFLLVGLGYYRHDAPLRRANLPEVTGQVVDRHQGRNDWALVQYTAEGRQFETKLRFSSRPPRIGTATPLRYLPGKPGRVRPAGSDWEPGYRQLLDFAGTFAVMSPLAYVLGVLGARRRLRKRRAGTTDPSQAASPASA